MELMELSEGVKEQEVEPFPDNVQIVAVFDSMGTQWHEGMNGPRGLRYEALPHVPVIRRLTDDEYDDVFNGLQIMERAALKRLNDGS